MIGNYCFDPSPGCVDRPLNCYRAFLVFFSTNPSDCDENWNVLSTLRFSSDCWLVLYTCSGGRALLHIWTQVLSRLQKGDFFAKSWSREVFGVLITDHGSVFYNAVDYSRLQCG